MEGTIGEIRLFAGTFAPKSWGYCNGAIQNISANTALFSILGTTYGGNGTSTFALPDFQSRMAMGTGTPPGGSAINCGDKSGAETALMTVANMPAHNHSLVGNLTVNANADASDSNNVPTGRYLSNGATLYSATADEPATTGVNVISIPTTSTGNGMPFSTLPPFLGMNYIICMYGVYPYRG